jgi:hypothetical protein
MSRVTFPHGLSARTPWCAALVATFLVGGLALASDVPKTRGVLEFKSGVVTTTKQDTPTLVGALSAAPRGAARHLVIQFERPVTAAERSELESAGVKLLHYLGDNAFFASVGVDRAAVAKVAESPALRCVLPVQRNWKLHPDLASGIVHDFAVVTPTKEEATKEPRDAVPDGGTVVAAYVLLHPDVSLEEGVRITQFYGAVVRSKLQSINGLVIEIPANNIPFLADEDIVEWIEPPLPKFSELNNSNRARVGADVAQWPPYGLDGSGVTVLVYDGGYGLSSHQDFGGRHHTRDNSGLSDHATHVAGTIGGSGAASGGIYRGMAPAVILESYGFQQPGGLQPGFLYTDPGDLEADYSQAINTYGADISNNSIGTNTAPNGFPCNWEGNYGVTDVLIDTIVRGDGSNPLFTSPFRIVWANGNERQTTRCLGVEGFPSPYHSTAPPACAKNHITVGALNSNDDSVTTFTSFGPADDGRMKPDISAPGCQSNEDNGVTSCSSSGGYTVKCGTSMASPTVCGIGALILQDYRQQYPGQPDFRNSTLKVLLAHTAVDLFNPGPDYQTGYGSVRAPAAIDLMRSGNFLEASVGQGQTYSVTVIVQPGQAPLRVTLAWDDVPGTPVVNPALVNDLDLRVFDSQSNQYYPWTLSPMNPSAPAVRTQANHVDNIEQVVIDNPTPGAYRVEVYGYNVPQGPQPFSLAATPYLVNCSSQGLASLDRAKYACSATATLRVVDCDLNTSDSVVDTVTVSIASTSEPGGESVLLTETDPASAAFLGTISLATTNAPGVLWIAPGDTVTMTYNDADNGNGQPAVVTATATVDCTPPVISNVLVNPLNPRDATINFNTDEPTQVVLRYGRSCGNLDQGKTVNVFRTSHSVQLTGLQDNTTYYFAIDAVDEAGNSTTDDNSGNCFYFTTPEIPDYFTQLFTGDNDLDNLSLIFTPNLSVDFYAGCVEENLTGQFPTNPAGGTPLSLTDDSYATVTLTGGARVWLYGVSYSTFYVGSNGYITFASGNTTYSESYANHFNQPRISALFDDLNPSAGGSVSWKQMSDRAVVTWLNVPEYGTSNQNSFQIEMFFDGQIRIHYLALAATDGLAGLSRGQGVPADFLPSDLSNLGSCGSRPPHASDSIVQTPVNTPVVVTLTATDDGLPDPPGALTYIVVTLPAHGRLYDLQGGQITAVPYALLYDMNQVEYRPTYGYHGSDGFQFKVNDGGTPPEGGDSNIATVSIVVGGPRVLYSFPLDQDPGWSVQGQWAFGRPTGGGSSNRDPTSGHTGLNVYGYNLNGDYTNNMPVYYLTTTPLDLTGVTQTELRFWRWLGVESATYDHANVQISNNGSTWYTIWEHTGGSVSDSAWSQRIHDISQWADNQATVWIRWGMGPTDSSVTYPGWNIDDIEIWGVVPYVPTLCPGDMNCDGQVTYADIDGFVEALGGESSWSHECLWLNADTTGDGDVTYADIDPFVALIGTSCP